MNKVKHVLSAIENGDTHAADQLLPLVYDELRQLASQRLAQEKPGQTLQATALVHEAYIRLVDVEAGKDQQWNSRGHFFAAAVEAMRRILVEQARGKRRVKHGGEWKRIDLNDACALVEAPSEDILSLDEALEALTKQDAVKAELVKLRYFGGLTIPEAADVLGISTATAERYWTFAKTWLYARLHDAEQSGNAGKKQNS